MSTLLNTPPPFQSVLKMSAELALKLGTPLPGIKLFVGSDFTTTGLIGKNPYVAVDPELERFNKLLLDRFWTELVAFRSLVKNVPPEALNPNLEFEFRESNLEGIAHVEELVTNVENVMNKNAEGMKYSVALVRINSHTYQFWYWLYMN